MQQEDRNGSNAQPADDRTACRKELIVARTRQRLLYLAFELEVSRALQARALAKTVRRSWRWRIGSAVIRGMSLLLRRRPQRTALDELEQLLDIRPSKLTVSRPLSSREAPPFDDFRLRPRNPANADRLALVTALPQAADAMPEDAGTTVIISNRNGADLLRQCLASLTECVLPHPTEIVVVDQAAEAESVQVVASYADRLPLRLVAYGQNYSFSYSHNVAARESKHPYLLFLNDDVFLSDSLAFVKALSTLQDSSIGLVGMPLRYSDGAGRIQHAGIQFFGDHRGGRIQPGSLHPKAPLGDAAGVIIVPAVTAAAAFCRRTDFLQAGGFFEGYNYGYEDVDLCLSLRQTCRLKCVVRTDITAVHDESTTVNPGDREAVRARRRANAELLQQRFGFGLRRQLWLERLQGEPFWTNERLLIGIAAPTSFPTASGTGTGDRLRVIDALFQRTDSVVVCLGGADASPNCYDVDGLDVVLSIDPDYDIRQLRNPKPALTLIACLHADEERWFQSAWIECYDLFIAIDQTSNPESRYSHVGNIDNEPFWLDGRRLESHLATKDHERCETTTQDAAAPLCYAGKDRTQPARAHPLRETIIRCHWDMDCSTLNAREAAQPHTPLDDRTDDASTPAHREAVPLHAVISSRFRGALRFGIKIAAPKRQKASLWGDWYFAASIATELKRQGHIARVDIVPDWHGPRSYGDDVVLVVRGLRSYQCRPDQVNILWSISHTSDVTTAELDLYDHAFVASDTVSARWQSLTRAGVSVLEQFSDPFLFYPDPDPSIPAHDLLFVGSWRKTGRPIVMDALDAGLPLTVYGHRWEGKIPQENLAGTFIPNAELRKYYSRCRVVLNDHAPDMRAAGILNNRVFDALFCGARLLSDDMPGLADLCPGRTRVYDGSSADLRTQYQRALEQGQSQVGELRASLPAFIAAHGVEARCRGLIEVARRYALVRPLAGLERGFS
jgi:GT2 family glycosyltransferase